MKEIVKQAAFAAGLNITRQTPSEEIWQLIRSLHPVDCGRNLIRIGGDAAGGYLLPDDLDGIEYCFSPGVSSVADFESHLATLQIRSFMTDYSVEAPPMANPSFVFDKKYLGANDTDTFTTLASWKAKYLDKNYSKDLILQMDVEGFEYEVILSTPAELLDSFRIIVAEFHYLEKIFDPIVFKFYKSSFDKLLKNFNVVHIHPNNRMGSVKKGDLEVPTAMEITFYNKRRTQAVKPALRFPHPLDRENAPHLNPLPLPKCWYSSS
jgi:hypothetical protein